MSLKSVESNDDDVWLQLALIDMVKETKFIYDKNHEDYGDESLLQGTFSAIADTFETPSYVITGIKKLKFYSFK